MSIIVTDASVIKPVDPFLWVVQSYLELLDAPSLVHGKGLKRLYVLANGVVTFSEEEINALVTEAEKTAAMPHSLHGFMVESIFKNLVLFAKELHTRINHRIIDIAHGKVTNPVPTFSNNHEHGVRSFYVPPVTFITRALKAVQTDFASVVYTPEKTPGTTIKDVAVEASMLLHRTYMEEGTVTPNSTAWGALVKLTEELVDLLEREARGAGTTADYKTRAVGALRILWVITKLLYGDLSLRPKDQDLNLIDLERTINLTNGTLVALPLPCGDSVKLFEDSDVIGVSFKARTYLEAVSAYVFYNNRDKT